MRYTYLGDALTGPDLIGMQCDPVRRPDGKCVVSMKMATALVVDEQGNKHVVKRRRLRLNKKEDTMTGTTSPTNREHYAQMAAEHQIEAPIIRELGSPNWLPILLGLIDGLGYIGGSFAAWLMSEAAAPPNDIDIFATSQEGAYKITSALCGFEDIYESPRLSETAIGFSLSSARLLPQNTLAIQILRPHASWLSFPQDIINAFDLNVSRAIVLDEKTVLCDTDAGGTYGKILRISDPVRTMTRVVKYAQRGVRFNRLELLKLFDAWDSASPERKAEIKTIAIQTEADEMPTDYRDWSNDNSEDDYQGD